MEKMDRLLADIAKVFLEEEFGKASADALSLIVDFFNIDMACFFKKSTIGNNYNIINRGFAENTGSDAERFLEESITALENSPLSLAFLEKGKHIIINSINEIPSIASKEKKILEENGINAVVMLPMVLEGSLIGIMCAAKKEEEKWTQNQISVLKKTCDAATLSMGKYVSEKTFENIKLCQENVPGVLFQWVMTSGAEANNSEGFFKYISPYVKELVGVSAEEITKDSKVFFSGIDDDDKNRFFSSLRVSTLTRQPWLVIFKYKDINGQEKWIKSTAKSRVNRDNAIIWDGFMEDITSSREKEASLLKLSNAVKYSSASIVITDVEGIIEYVNPAFSEISGYESSEVIGKTPRILKSDETPVEVYKELWRKIKAGEKWRSEIRNKRKDGKLFWQDLSISPVFDAEGKMIHFIAVSDDVTGRKNFEASLKEAKDKAEEATRAKSDFLAAMSHEIRTPMNGILGMANLLENTTLTTEQKDYLEAICTSGEALLTVINDILDFSKIEAGHMELEKIPFNLRKMVMGICSLLSSKAEDEKVEILSNVENDVPQNLIGDKTRLRQILLNLMNNAIKFTEEGRVSIDVSLVDKKDDVALLLFKVKDTGIGMDEETKDKLFNEFVQADSSISRRFGGTGLGLVICKRLTNLMDGEIGVESTPGEGSCFWFEIPFPETEQKETQEKNNIENASEKIPPQEILLVEDNPINLKVVMTLLRKRGHKLSLASNGIEAIEAVQKKDFDMVFMDVQMPEMDGLTATKEIRKMGGMFKELPIIAMTANALKGDDKMCLDAGMDSYLAKPISPTALFDVLSRYSKKKDNMENNISDIKEEDKEEKQDGIEVINLTQLESLEEMLGEEGSKELITDFSDYGLTLVDTIIEASKKQDMENLRISSHNFKSTSASFGLNSLSDLSKQIEMACRNGEDEKACSLCDGIKERFDEAVEKLKEVRPNLFN